MTETEERICILELEWNEASCKFAQLVTQFAAETSVWQSRLLYEQVAKSLQALLQAKNCQLEANQLRKNLSMQPRKMIVREFMPGSFVIGVEELWDR